MRNVKKQQELKNAEESVQGALCCALAEWMEARKCRVQLETLISD